MRYKPTGKTKKGDLLRLKLLEALSERPDTAVGLTIRLNSNIQHALTHLRRWGYVHAPTYNRPTQWEITEDGRSALQTGEMA